MVDQIVFDLWVERWRRRHARGDVVVVRYADDVIVGFQNEQESRRFQQELSERMRSFSLELHPEETTLVRIGRYAQGERAKYGKAGTFNFLGFTHICGKTTRGGYLVVRRTMRKRMQAKLKQIRLELRERMHEPVPEQGKWLGSVVRGHFAYYAVPTNSVRLGRSRLAVIKAWAHTLQRRSQVTRITRQRMRILAARWLPPTRVRHPWPSERFDARTRGRSPVR